MKSPKKLGSFSVALMGAVSIFSLIDIPIMAKYGALSALYYALAAILFFIPSALVCAELATGWPKAGGIYVWTKEAFGDRVGFLTIWLEWINNVIVFPASLSFTALIVSYVFPQHLELGKYWILSIMLVIFWGLTLLNLRGIKSSSKLSNIGFIVGMVFPCALIICLGAWFVSVTPLHKILSLLVIAPDHPSIFTSAFLVSLVLGYSGIQIVAFHAEDVENPQKNYPRAILIATSIIIFFYVLSALAIFIVIPAKNINIITGLMQALESFFKIFNLSMFVPLLAVLIIFGRMSSLNMWIIGPARGLATALENSNVPQIITRKNTNGAPVYILFIQAIITTLLSISYLFVSSIVNFFWVLLALSSALTLVMYMLMFLAGLVMRYSKPNTIRTYKVPGGKFGIWLVAGCGFLVCFFALILCFIPPEQLFKSSAVFYKDILMVGVVVLVTAPVFFVIRKTKP
ncbi:MAG: APC family permease [Gammaproteobacteria bacterium]|nr:APC family permease [Gammaproteobacteria bacterium]